MTRKRVELDIHTTIFKQEGKTESGYAYDTIKLVRYSGHRMYCTGIKNGIPMQEVRKTMQLEDGKIYLSFGKKKIEIGTYSEEVA